MKRSLRELSKIVPTARGLEEDSKWIENASKIRTRAVDGNVKSWKLIR